MTNSREVNTFSGRVKVSAYGVIHVSTVENPFSLKKKIIVLKSGLIALFYKIY